VSGRDGRRAAAVAGLAAALFLFTAPFCGLYLDDYSFFAMLQGVGPGELWTAFLHYVPGRNLHILFFDGLIRLTGGSVPAMHLAGVGFDALNAALYYLLLRRLTGLRSVALAAAAAFLVAANHGETHFWINNIPQVQVPTTLLLAAFLLASRPRRLAAALAVYAAALFTYDQAFFLWPLLLAVAWSSDPAPRRNRYAGAAVLLLALNCAHLAARYLAPISSGGRPLIRAGDFLKRCAQASYSVLQGALPWPAASYAHRLWSVPVVLLSLAAAAWLARAMRADARAEDAGLAAWTSGGGWRTAAAAGLAWTALAYAPNLFWYMSPRHNLIPSLGWCLALASAGAWAAGRGRREASLVAAAGILLFAVSAVSDVHEGTQWVESKRLQDGFAAAVKRLPPPVETVFLVGAPRRLGRAPGFDLPHDVIFAAGRALGQAPLKIGDYEATPTRHGLVYFNDLTLMPASYFHWVSGEASNLLAYDAGAGVFRCASSLSVRLPDGSSREEPLRGGADCTARVPMDADAFLESSISVRSAPAPRAAPRAAGLILAGARASVVAGVTRLELAWTVEKPPRGTLAFLFRVKDASGRIVLDGVFPSRGARRPYPMIWPLVDDEAPALRLAAGAGLRQIFLVRRAAALGAGSILELDAYELDGDGRAVAAGGLAFPLAVN
jgi:hypothetical protein